MQRTYKHGQAHQTEMSGTPPKRLIHMLLVATLAVDGANWGSGSDGAAIGPMLENCFQLDKTKKVVREGSD
jgi:hypothetical protein